MKSDTTTTPRTPRLLSRHGAKGLPTLAAFTLLSGVVIGQTAPAGFTKVFSEDFNSSADGTAPDTLVYDGISGTTTVVNGALRSDLTPNGSSNLNSSGTSASVAVTELGGPAETATDFVFSGTFTAAENTIQSSGNRGHFVGIAVLNDRFDNWTPKEGNVIAMRYGGTGNNNLPGEILAGSGVQVGIGGDVSLGTFSGDISVGSTLSFTLTGTYSGGPSVDVEFTVSDGTVEESFSYTFPTAGIGNSFGVYTRQATTGGSFDIDFDDLCISAKSDIIDNDGDGLSNDEEIIKGTDPNDDDTDDDGINDGIECSIETDPLDPDTDKDCAIDGVEVEQGSNPLDPDSDDDGILDGKDPTPTEPGVPDDFIEQGLCNLAYHVVALDLDNFVGSRYGHGCWNWWAKRIHRHRLACQIYWACQEIRCGHFDHAKIRINRAIKRVDGESHPRDWMVSGEAKDYVLSELQTLKGLIDLL